MVSETKELKWYRFVRFGSICCSTVRAALLEGGGGEGPKRAAHLRGAEAVDGAVLQTQRRDTHALPLVHDQVQREILHEELGVVPQRLLPPVINKTKQTKIVRQLRHTIVIEL